MLHHQATHQPPVQPPTGQSPGATSSQVPERAGLEQAHRAGPEHPGSDQEGQLESCHSGMNPHTQVFRPKPALTWTEILQGLETVG